MTLKPWLTTDIDIDQLVVADQETENWPVMISMIRDGQTSRLRLSYVQALALARDLRIAAGAEEATRPSPPADLEGAVR